MKKILNLLLGGVLITTSSVQVVACGNSSSNTNIKQSGLNKSISQAQAVANKIKNTDIENLSYSHGTYSTENDSDVTALRKAIEDANPNTGLTQGDVDNITFNQNKKIQPDATAPTEVDGTVEIDGMSATVKFHFKISNFAPSTGAVSNANITVDPQKIGETYYLATEDRGLLKSNMGNSWQQVQNIQKIDTSIVKYNNHYFIGTDGNGLYKSNGDAVSGFTEVNGTSGWDVTKIGQMAHTTDGPFYLATDGHGLRQTNDGSTWTLSPGIKANDDIQTLPTEVSGIKNPNIKYDYITSDSGNGVYQKPSTDTTWQTDNNLPDFNYSSQVVELGDHYFVGANGGSSPYRQPQGTGLWYADGYNYNWAMVNYQKYPNSLPQNVLVPTAPVQINNIDYLATSNDGLWSKPDNATVNNWKQIANIKDLNNAPVKINGLYYLTTNGNGLWSSTDGVKWTRVPGIPSDAKISKPPVKLSVNGSDTFYVITEKGLYTVQ